MGSDFLNDAEKMKAELGDALCLAKWQQVSLHLTNGLTNSCYHPPLHEIDASLLDSNPSALHNTPYKKERRKEMLNGIKCDECNYCWNIERTGNLSDRHYRSGEPWAAIHLDRIRNQPFTVDEIPNYVEVNFSNACNLACSYCSPQFSTTWAAQAERYGAYPTSVPHNAPEHFQGRRRVIPNREFNPYVEAFWRWWPDLYPKLKHFRMTGGEPILDKNTYRVFNYVLENPKPDLHLNVTSNFSVDDGLFNHYLDYVKKICDGENVEHFMQYVSVDTWGDQAEYIRPGLQFKKLQNNVERFLTEIPGRNSLTFIITMNNLVVPGIQELLEWILQLRIKHSFSYQRVWFDTPLLRSPSWQSLQILPEAYAWKLEQVRDWMQATPMKELEGFKDYEVQRMNRVIAMMKQHNDDKKLKADFYRFFSEHDKRHRLNFLNTFPEMKMFWDDCKYWTENA
jgi:MoaA/NifB/PqqE/SkfB family radical SAM enzyme